MTERDGTKAMLAFAVTAALIAVILASDQATAPGDSVRAAGFGALVTGLFTKYVARHPVASTTLVGLGPVLASVAGLPILPYASSTFFVAGVAHSLGTRSSLAQAGQADRDTADDGTPDQ